MKGTSESLLLFHSFFFLLVGSKGAGKLRTREMVVRSPPTSLMAALPIIGIIFLFLIICVVHDCAAQRDVVGGRSPLQKWLHAADWVQKHEVPFRWFLMQDHSYYRYVNRGSSILVFAAHANWSLGANDGRYVILKLNKLRRGERRKVQYSLMMQGMKDTHIIDDLHVLTYIDSIHVNRARMAFEADNRASPVPLSSLTVLDIFSTPVGSRFKLSRVIRTTLNRCNNVPLRDGLGKEKSGDGDRDSMTRRKFQRRLPLDVRMALGRENIVEESLRSVFPKPNDASATCRWSIIASFPGKGHVRWELTLSSPTSSSGEGKREEKEEEEENGERVEYDDVVCHCAPFINVVVRHPAVRWMEVAVEHVVPLNLHASALVQRGEQKDEKRPFRPLWDAGINGTGELVGVADSGIDFDSCFFHDPKQTVAIYPAVNHRHRKVVSYIPSNFASESTVMIGDKKRGHGTHVSGTVAGHILGNRENSQYNGVAKGAKIMFMSLGSETHSLLSIPVDITDIFKPGYKEGARIFSNSWGFFAPREYTAVEKTIDTFANLVEDALIIFAAGNSPTSGLLTPCRAKNMICIGAHKNSFDPSVQNKIPVFSSPGPTYDNRIKPELVAPGDVVISALSDGNITTKQCTVVNMRGTSMATAALAGSVALMRQHLREKENIISPSSSLLKALLAHSTVKLEDVRVSGFGRLDLSLFFTPTGINGWLRDREIISHHQSNVYHFSLQPSYKEEEKEREQEELRVSLAWTDVGTALEGSMISLINDLDLLLVDSQGTIYYAGENKTADHTNIIEQISLLPSSSFSLDVLKNFRVFVYGSHIHEGKNNQYYSLVVSGPGVKYINGVNTSHDGGQENDIVCPNNCSGNGVCVGGVCTCHAGYRFIDCSMCDEDILCHGHGECEQKTLQCTCDNDNFQDKNCSICKKGWYGPSCSSNCTCSHRGTCNFQTGECLCTQDRNIGGSGCFTGPNCEYCCRDFTGEQCNVKSYWCREDGWPVYINSSSSSFSQDGYIQINGFGTYSPMLTCRWIIEAPIRQKIRVEFLDFNVEYPKDAVFFYDGNEDEAQGELSPMRVESGIVPKGTFFSSPHNVLSIIFTSQWSHIRKGFLLYYRFENTNTCHIRCHKNSFCSRWSHTQSDDDGRLRTDRTNITTVVVDGICMCVDGYAGWTCDGKIDSNKKIILYENNKNKIKKFDFLINENVQLLLSFLTVTTKKGWKSNLFVSFDDNFLLLLQQKAHGEMFLRISFLQKRTKIINEEIIKITSLCRFIIITLHHHGYHHDHGDGSGDKDLLDISFTLLHNASVVYMRNASESDSFGASVYLEKTTSAVNNEADTQPPLLMYCSSSLPPTVAALFVNNSTKPTGHKYDLRFLIPLFFMFLVFIVTCYRCVGREFTEDYVSGTLPAAAVTVLATPSGDDSDKEEGNGDWESLGDARPTERGGEYTQLEVEMVERGAAKGTSGV